MFSVVTIITRSSHRRCSANKGALKNFANSQENTYVWVSFLIKLQAWIPFLQYPSGRLLLYTLSFNKYKHSPNKYKISLKIIVIFRFATETCSSKICLCCKSQKSFWNHMGPLGIFFLHFQYNMLQCKRQKNAASSHWVLAI